MLNLALNLFWWQTLYKATMKQKRTYFVMKVDACEELKAKFRNFLHCRQLNSLIQSILTVGLYYVFKYIRGALHKRGLLKLVVYAKKLARFLGISIPPSVEIMKKINRAISISKKLVLPKPFWSDWNTQRQGQIAKTAYKATLLISSTKAGRSIMAVTRMSINIYKPKYFTVDTRRT